MTFVAPVSSADAISPAIRLFDPAVKGRLPIARIRAADEDSARRALGADFAVPAALASAASLEDLARVALG